MQTRKMIKTRYLRGMTEVLEIEKAIEKLPRSKQKQLVAWFQDFVETYGFDLTEDEKASIREAQADRDAGRIENFVKLEDLEKELGI